MKFKTNVHKVSTNKYMDLFNLCDCGHSHFCNLGVYFYGYYKSDAAGTGISNVVLKPQINHTLCL